jgi:hypothetical protein
MPKQKRGSIMPVLGRFPAAPSTARQRRDKHEQRRTAWRKILTRTYVAKFMNAIAAALADMSDVDHLPVVTGLSPPKPPPKRRKQKTVAPLGLPAVPDEAFLDRMAMITPPPPKPPRARPRKRVSPKADARARPAAPAPA